VAHNKNSAGCI